MIPRILEPEVMDTSEEASDYDAMDHREVNRRFVDDLLQEWTSHGSAVMGDGQRPTQVLDVGTGTAQIPIELCRRNRHVAIVGVDLSESMLALGQTNVASRGLQHQIDLQLIDAKSLPFDNETFEVVMSNSIVHHIPAPAPVLTEMARVVRPGGLLFVRDLLRPTSAEEIEHLVAVYAGLESVHQQQLFRQSLWASLTLEEVHQESCGISGPPPRILQTGDRHWTLIWHPL